MGWRVAQDTRQLDQQRADIEEALELKQWRIAYPAHRQLVQVVDEAARRAECVARLEDALRRLH